MKTFKNWICGWLIFCLIGVACPKITLANGPARKSYHQRIGIIDSKDLGSDKKNNMEYYLLYCRNLPDETFQVDGDDFYSVEIRSNSTKDEPTMKLEDLTTLIILGEITDEYGTFPVTKVIGLGDGAHYHDNIIYDENRRPTGEIKLNYPHLTTLYIPESITDSMSFSSFIFNTTIKDIYYSGDEVHWNELCNRLSQIKEWNFGGGSTDPSNFLWKKPHPFLSANAHFNTYPKLNVTYEGHNIFVDIEDTTINTQQ